MAKPRGYPDRRGMGAQSDPIVQPFTPSDHHLTRQLARARALIATGITPAQAAHMLSIPLQLLTPEALHQTG